VRQPTGDGPTGIHAPVESPRTTKPLPDAEFVGGRVGCAGARHKAQAWPTPSSGAITRTANPDSGNCQIVIRSRGSATTVCKEVVGRTVQ